MHSRLACSLPLQCDQGLGENAVKLAYCLTFPRVLRQNEHRSSQAHLSPSPAVVRRSLRQQSLRLVSF